MAIPSVRRKNPVSSRDKGAINCEVNAVWGMAGKTGERVGAVSRAVAVGLRKWLRGLSHLMASQNGIGDAGGFCSDARRGRQ